MKKFLTVPVLILLVIMFSVAQASAKSDWLFSATDDTRLPDLSWDDEEDVYPGQHDFYNYSKQTEFEFVAEDDIDILAWHENGYVIDTLHDGEIVRGSMIFSSDETDDTYLEVYNEEMETYMYVNTKRLRALQGDFPKLAKHMEVIGETVNVRRHPDIESEVLEVIEGGTILTVYEFVCVYDGRFRIWALAHDYYGNDLGFVSCRYLKPAK